MLSIRFWSILACASGIFHLVNLPLLTAGSPLDQTTSSTIKLGDKPDRLTIENLSIVPELFISQEGGGKIQFALYRNNIFIQVSVNDSEPRLFWVDTGGGTSFINSRHPKYRDFLQAFPRKHVLNVVKDSQTINDALVLYNCPSLKFGGVELKNSIVEMKESDDFDKTLQAEIGLEICGMIGTTALRGMVTEIDYPQGTIRFMKPETFDPGSKKEAKSCPFLVHPLQGNLPFVSVELNGKQTAEFDFDTGCSSALRITEGVLKDLGLDPSDASLEIQSIKFGDISLQKLPARKSSWPFCLMGYGALRNFRITMDYSREKIYFE